ncbi:MAG: AAA family ATPase [Eubacterium sp.]|nr:AAA family ATPase [Eubacterium sp.]
MSEFDKIIGYEDIKAELSRFADVLKEPEKYSKLGVTTPSGIMLYGDPGVGKTLMAKCFIAETGCKVFTLRKDKPNGDFVKHIKETFESAKKDSSEISIVFLDDLDKFANEDTDHQDAEEYVAIQSCIDECKGYGVFAVATVNDIRFLPESLLRAGRFDKEICVKTPKGKNAKRIIEYYLSQKRVANNIDTELISRLMEDRSCAELETVINEAGIYAGFARKELIEQEHITKACMRVLFDFPECISQFDSKNDKYVSVHEAGHTVVAEILDPGCVTLVSICRYSGDMHGITKIHKPDDYMSSKEMVESVIISILGGKAATEMVYGIADMGCNSDMENVFDLVSMLVDDSCALGFETYTRYDSSRYVSENRDRLIASEVNRYYQIAKKIIVENREFVDAVTEALMDHKTLTFREMQRIKKAILYNV